MSPAAALMFLPAPDRSSSRLTVWALVELFVTSPDRLMALPFRTKLPAPLLKVIPANKVPAAKSLAFVKRVPPQKLREAPETGGVLQLAPVCQLASAPRPVQV